MIRSRGPIPFWRDVRVLRVAGQVVFLAAIAGGIWWLANNLTTNLEQSGLNIGFRFLRDTAGFPISEGIAYSPTDANGYAFLVGIVNTIRVAVLGIVLATILGTLVGIARLSGNWLVRKLATLYVETVRNIPLLVQLFFWYFAVMLTALPLVENAIRHGLEQTMQGGRIGIRAEAVDKVLRITVSDTGAGMGEWSVPGTGLSNVRDRLRALFRPVARRTCA